jgi:hypothetical protein
MKRSTLRATVIAAAALIGGTTAYAAGTQDEDAKVAPLPHAAPMPERPAGKWVSWTDPKTTRAATCSMDGLVMAQTNHETTLVVIKDNNNVVIKFGGMAWKQIYAFVENKKQFNRNIADVIESCQTLTEQAAGKPEGSMALSWGILNITDKEGFPVDFPLPPDDGYEEKVQSHFKLVNAPSP